jgi:hypothetical protein
MGNYLDVLVLRKHILIIILTLTSKLENLCFMVLMSCAESVVGLR